MEVVAPSSDRTDPVYIGKYDDGKAHGTVAGKKTVTTIPVRAAPPAKP